jgi:hypothetical protein
MEKLNNKNKGTMIFSLGEKRMSKFKTQCEDLEYNYSSIIQMLIDDWMKKVKGENKKNQ